MDETTFNYVFIKTDGLTVTGQVEGTDLEAAFKRVIEEVGNHMRTWAGTSSIASAFVSDGKKLYKVFDRSF
jgi:hypothetical protein